MAERAYERLEYLKGCMDALYWLKGDVERAVVLKVPALLENGFNLTRQKFQSGDYKECLEICERTIGLVKEYSKKQCVEAFKKFSEVG